MQNTRRAASKCAPGGLLTYLWEILYEPLLLKGQFHGFTYQLNGQFQGIPLEKSQPEVRTFARRAAPSKRTFSRANAPSKPTLVLIPCNFHHFISERRKLHLPALALHPRTHTRAATGFASICLIPLSACRVRSSFSIRAKRTWWSPCSPNPMPGDTATLASLSRSFENSSDPSSR